VSKIPSPATYRKKLDPGREPGAGEVANICPLFVVPYSSRRTLLSGNHVPPHPCERGPSSEEEKMHTTDRGRAMRLGYLAVAMLIASLAFAPIAQARIDRLGADGAALPSYAPFTEVAVPYRVGQMLL